MSKSKDITSIEERMKAAAAKTLANKVTETTGVPSISTRHGRLSIDGNEIPGSKLPVVVLASAIERTFYSSAFDPDNIANPDCFALAEDIGDLRPHENVADPVSDKCRGCPKAEFGTAAVGKGPACKTRVRLIVMPIAGADAPEEVGKADLAQVKVPPTSVKNWENYASGIASQGIPVWAVGTEVRNAPHDKKIFELTFRPTGDKLDKKVLTAVADRADEAQAIALHPWTTTEEA